MTLSLSSDNAELQELAATLERWQHDPVAFVEECIGVTPDPWQQEVMYDLLEHGRVSVAACHGPGKDATAAWIVLWVLTCFEHPKSLCTAPTAAQLHDLLWAEVAKWHLKMPEFFRAQLEITKGRIFLKEHKDTWFATARTARPEKPEALAGIHADVVLVIADEASGVPDACFEVTEGALTGPLWFILIIGNPTQITGYFYDSHHSDRERWKAYRVMAAAAHDGSPLPPGVFLSERVAASYVEAIAKKYGKDSNVYRVRVLGMFPTSSDDQVIPLHWLELARNRTLPENWQPRHHVVLGLDVALFGSDDSALCIRQGPLVLGFETWHGHDREYTAGRAVMWCKRLAEKKLKPRYVFVDANGVGAGVVKLLRKDEWLHANGITVIGVNAGAPSPDPECAHLRDALWWRARKIFDPKQGNKLGECPVIPDTLSAELAGRLTGELATPKFGFTPTLKIKVESKEEMRDRQVGSPDLADAFNLTLYFEAGMPEPKKQEPVPADRSGRFAR